MTNRLLQEFESIYALSRKPPSKADALIQEVLVGSDPLIKEALENGVKVVYGDATSLGDRLFRDADAVYFEPNLINFYNPPEITRTLRAAIESQAAAAIYPVTEQEARDVPKVLQMVVNDIDCCLRFTVPEIEGRKYLVVYLQKSLD